MTKKPASKKTPAATATDPSPNPLPSVTVTVMENGQFDIQTKMMDVRAVPTVLEMANQQFRRTLGLPTIG